MPSLCFSRQKQHVSKVWYLSAACHEEYLPWGPRLRKHFKHMLCGYFCVLMLLLLTLVSLSARPKSRHRRLRKSMQQPAELAAQRYNCCMLKPTEKIWHNGRFIAWD